jgi:hypothetical protein
LKRDKEGLKTTFNNYFLKVQTLIITRLLKRLEQKSHSGILVMKEKDWNVRQGRRKTLALMIKESS